AAPGSKERYHIGQRGGAYGVIDDAFAVAEQAAQDHVCTRWQLGGHLSLPAPQHKGFQAFAQAFGSARSAVSDGTRVARLEILAAAEQPTVEEVQLTPELIEAVLHRCASEGQTEMGAEVVGRPRYLAGRIFNRLSLVEHHGVPHVPCQDMRVQTQDGIRCQSHVRGRHERALCTVIDGYLESWQKALQLIGPVVQHTGRRHYERMTLEHTEGLQSFAKSHIVGKQRSQPSLAEKCQPVDTMPLVGTQGRLQPFWQGCGGNPVKILQERVQTGKLRWTWLLQYVTQASEIGNGSARQRDMDGARRQQIRHALTIAL